MTVPASKRRESSMAYIENAEKLAASIFRYTAHLPKRYNQRILTPLFCHAEECVYHCRAANQVYVNDRATFEKRRGHLLDAQAHVLHVETLLGILYELMAQIAADGDGKQPNDNVFGGFADMITTQRKLIAGCKRRDAAAYKAMVADG